MHLWTMGTTCALTADMNKSKKQPPKGQKTYSVGGVITISVHTEVVASSPEEAREIAINDRGIMSLCHHCASADASVEWVTSGELDCDTPAPHDGQTELEVTEI